MFIASLFTIGRHGSNLNVYQQRNKEDVVHIYNGILLSHKKQNNTICSSMDEPRDCHTEWSKSDTGKKYHMLLLMYGILGGKKGYQWTYL